MSEKGAEKRQHNRVPVQLRVRFPQEDLQAFSEAQATNLSHGGMFIKTPQPKPPGTLLDFEIQLKDGQRILKGRGEVAWMRPAGEQQTPGMGMKFLSLDESSLELVRQIVAEQFDLDEEPEPEHKSEANKKQASGRERRAFPRATVGLIVQVGYRDVEDFIQGYALNISRGGIFIRSSKPQAVGTRLRFEIQLQDGQTLLQGAGLVTWVQHPTGPGERPRVPGMGIKFSELDKASQDLVERILVESNSAPRAEPQPEESPVILQSQEEDVGKDQPEAELGATASEAPIQPKLAGSALKRRVVSALVASLRLSRIPEFLDIDTLRSLLGSWYQWYFDGSNVDLTTLFNALIAEESIELEEAALPLEIFNLARSYHGVGVRFPEMLEQYPGSALVRDRAKRRMDNFSQALEEAEAEHEQEVAPEAPARRQKKTRKARGVAGVSKVRRVAAYIGLVIAIAALAASYLSVTPSKAVSFDLGDVSDIIVLKSGSLHGSSLAATIDDQRWGEMTATQKHETIDQTAAVLAEKGIDTITLLDENQSPCVIVAPNPSGEGRRIMIGDDVWQTPAGKEPRP